ncbi:MAG: carbohydrate binding family 9 domain-containing protein, partial [Flavitalea sp.]
MPTKIIVIFLLLIHGVSGMAQLKKIGAVKISDAPRIDGSLDEAVWQMATPATEFVTTSPVYGKPASDRTEVRVLYDNTSLYIGAYLYGDPALIRRQFTPRDQERQGDVDHFAVFIDSYKDKQNAYQFLVTSRNVQSDARVSPNITPASGIYGD